MLKPFLMAPFSPWGQELMTPVKFSTKLLAESALKFNYPGEMYYMWVGSACHVVSVETLEIIQMDVQS